MEAERKSGTRRRRKPLSDLTNAVSLSELEPPLKPSVPSAPKRIAPNPSSPGSALLPSTPSRPIASSSGHDVSGRSMFCATYNRRKPADKSKRKENAVGVPMTSSPARKIRNARNKLNDEGDGAGSKSCSIPNKRKQQRPPSRKDVPDDALQDYIREQKSYFEEIDAFELPEEEVASVNDLD
ncbi:uncharacterized protein LOC115743696 isoform X3 [Rhodamnia argentea]|uniref:Uncharacterized protein LOC115743696 isoform X3 n=1 Tax=Rhodamnia argentea TaxID=178133 RepID=A0A8B8PJW7_9MYRT|nr:uncharacterized protein LOC115743696 isoform X3 [Rhodamnia argentea]